MRIYEEPDGIADCLRLRERLQQRLQFSEELSRLRPRLVIRTKSGQAIASHERLLTGYLAFFDPAFFA